jgi:pilus assembly protein CpaD
MSKSNFGHKAGGVPATGHRLRIYRPTAPVMAAIAVALLSGCSAMKRDSITVGSVPDDYRTNHPIVIAEKEQVLDLPVGASDRGMTGMQKTAIQGFIASYDRSAAPVVRILIPSGAANDVAAADAARDMVHVLKRNGVPGGRISIIPYQASSVEASAPVRISYMAMRAQTDRCGRWPDDILKDADNKHYANFGCSYQNNLAAQIANPADLLAPRKQTEIDAENRDNAIAQYKDRAIAPEFLGTSEVDY